MLDFDVRHEITHEWSHYKYVLWFKDGKLRRIDEYSKSTNIFVRVYYRNPNTDEFGITTFLLEELVGYLCRGKKELDIKEFLKMFADDKQYYNIIKSLLKEEKRRMNDTVVRITEALGE